MHAEEYYVLHSLILFCLFVSLLWFCLAVFSFFFHNRYACVCGCGGVWVCGGVCCCCLVLNQTLFMWLFFLVNAFERGTRAVLKAV